MIPCRILFVFFMNAFISELREEGSHEMTRELVSVWVASEGFGRTMDYGLFSTFVVFNQWILLGYRMLSEYFVFLDF